MTTKTLCVQNFVSRRSPTGERETEWKVSEFEVESFVDERGIEFLSVDGVRFALSYLHMNENVKLVTTIENPNLLVRGKAQDIALLMWTSGTGVHSPSKHGCWLKESR